MAGYGKGRFGPDDKVTRAQFATFLARALDLPSGTSSFSDVPSTHPLAGGLDEPPRLVLLEDTLEMCFIQERIFLVNKWL